MSDQAKGILHRIELDLRCFEEEGVLALVLERGLQRYLAKREAFREWCAARGVER